MIIESSGDLLKADVDAVVNTVNCVGVMGKGIALQVKRRYPEVFKEYERRCKDGTVQIGTMLPVETGELERPHWVINFPTKTHWRSPSKLSYISQGLDDLQRVVKDLGLRSVAIPPLGAGNGGLNWLDVEPLIRAAFSDAEVDVHLFAPTNARQSVRPVSKAPNFTWGRAVVLALADRYCEGKSAVEGLASASLSHLELQKLLYFADSFDRNLRLKYAPGRYGPYSDSLRHVIQGMEGSYLRGFGDGSDPVLDLRPIELTEEGRSKLLDYLDHPKGESVTRIVDNVAAIIEGFEEPYGVELLASTHWVIMHEGAVTPQLAAEAVRNWTQRKGRIFTDRHIGIAFRHLQTVGGVTDINPGG